MSRVNDAKFIPTLYKILKLCFCLIVCMIGSKENMEELALGVFINAIVFDSVLVIASPIMLLYSSQELRNSIISKLTEKTCL